MPARAEFFKLPLTRSLRCARATKTQSDVPTTERSQIIVKRSLTLILCCARPRRPARSGSDLMQSRNSFGRGGSTAESRAHLFQPLRGFLEQAFGAQRLAHLGTRAHPAQIGF